MLNESAYLATWLYHELCIRDNRRSGFNHSAYPKEGSFSGELDPHLVGYKDMYSAAAAAGWTRLDENVLTWLFFRDRPGVGVHCDHNNTLIVFLPYRVIQSSKILDVAAFQAFAKVEGSCVRAVVDSPRGSKEEGSLPGIYLFVALTKKQMETKRGEKSYDKANSMQIKPIDRKAAGVTTTSSWSLVGYPAGWDPEKEDIEGAFEFLLTFSHFVSTVMEIVSEVVHQVIQHKRSLGCESNSGSGLDGSLDGVRSMLKHTLSNHVDVENMCDAAKDCDIATKGWELIDLMRWVAFFREDLRRSESTRGKGR